jgi:hypothetical protein
MYHLGGGAQPASPTCAPACQPDADQTSNACHRDPNLQFVEEVALPPPEVKIDLVEQQKNEAELAEAINAPLPPEDDDELQLD